MGRRRNYEYDADYYRERVRKLWKNCPDLTNREIGVYFGISGETVANYLKKAKKNEM